VPVAQAPATVCRERSEVVQRIAALVEQGASWLYVTPPPTVTVRDFSSSSIAVENRDGDLFVLLSAMVLKSGRCRVREVGWRS